MNNIKNSNESIKIKNIIKDAEDKKSLLLIDMGSLTYQKIRENIIIINDDKNNIAIKTKLVVK